MHASQLEILTLAAEAGATVAACRRAAAQMARQLRIPGLAVACLTGRVAAAVPAGDVLAATETLRAVRLVAEQGCGHRLFQKNSIDAQPEIG